MNSDFWSIISSVATLATAIVALCTILVTVFINYRSQLEKHFSVQPWFHITNTSNVRGGPFEISIVNDGNINVSIEKIQLVFINGNQKMDLKYKYRKSHSDEIVGKKIDVSIPWHSCLYGQPVQIKITFLNPYRKRMVAYSGKRLIVNQTVEKQVLEFVENENYFRPFINNL